MKAFVVEDNDGIRDIVSGLLESRGHTVSSFADAESAWDEMGAQSFDIAVLDWGLPGMDGLEFCRRLRARPDGGFGVIIFLTGRSEPEDLDEVVAAGANDYVAKPFKLDALEIRVAFAERQSVVLAEQIRATRALREAEAKYKALVEGVSVVTYTKCNDDAGTIAYISPQVERLTGWTVEEITRQQIYWPDLVHPDDRDAAAKADRIAKESGERFSCDYRQRSRGGEYRWFRDEAEPIRDDHGNVSFWQGVISDVTEQKTASRALLESEQRHRELSAAAEKQANQLSLLDRVRSALAGELELDSVFRIVVEATAETLGYPFVSLYVRQGDVLALQHQVGYNDPSAIYYTMAPGQGVLGSVFESGQPRLVRNVKLEPAYLSADNDVVCEICVPLFDGDQVAGAFNVETAADQPLNHDDLRLLFGVAEHVNNAISRARLYGEARESERRLRSVLENIQEVVFQTDAAGHWTFLNNAWEAITGHPVQQTLGRHIADFARPERRAEFEHAVSALASGQEAELRGDFQVRTATGAYRWVEAHAARVDDGEGPSSIFGTLTDITERKRAEEALFESQARYRDLALHDPLTSLPNRSLFMERLESALVACATPNAAVSVLFLDLDGFKVVNDSLGHDAGDRLLVQVGRRLLECARPEATVARLGGDEFAILMADTPAFEIATATSEVILSAFRSPFSLDEQDAPLATSIGLAGHRGPGGNAGELLRNADTALYAAKSNGRGTFTRYEPRMSAAILARFQRESELRRAIEQEELRLYYQPAFDLRTGSVTSVEALVRWQHPDLGLLSPTDFIALAESSGLIVPLGTAVLRSICRDWIHWRAISPGALPRIGINLSARQMRETTLAADIEDVLGQFGIDPGCLELEISESAAVIDAASTSRTLHQLRDLGVALAIDDFGTGYGTFSSLRDLPVSAVKIDRGFIVGLGRDRTSSAIVRAMTALAQTLGMSVTAKGIESISQLAHAREIGIDRGQGYYFTRPMEAAAVESLIADGSPVNALLLNLG